MKEVANPVSSCRSSGLPVEANSKPQNMAINMIRIRSRGIVVFPFHQKLRVNSSFKSDLIPSYDVTVCGVIEHG